MAGSVLPSSVRDLERAVPATVASPRHAGFVRITHWLTVICFVALLVSGIEIIISHPRFYWGEIGNVNVRPLFTLPLPSSRDAVPTGFGYVMPDQNGWSRALHFQSAWLLIFTGIVYGIAGAWTGHFRKNLLPQRGTRNWRAYRARFARSFRRGPADPAEAHAYNVVQRTAYLAVIFVLFPLVIWTGLALSPAFDSAFPWAVDVLGGRQSARTLHFFISILLVVFVIGHVLIVALSGFTSRMRALITGTSIPPEEHS